MKKVFQICLFLACMGFIYNSLKSLAEAADLIQKIGKNSDSKLMLIHLAHLLSLPLGLVSCYFQLTQLNESQKAERHELDEHLIADKIKSKTSKMRHVHVAYMFVLFSFAVYFLPLGHYSLLFEKSPYFEMLFIIFFSVSGVILYFDSAKAKGSE